MTDYFPVFKIAGFDSMTTVAGREVISEFKRRLSRLLSMIVVLAGLFGCATGSLWTDQRQQVQTSSYTETVSSVLMSRDGRKLVVVTPAYHYIFDAPDVVVKTLGSAFQHATRAEFGTFHVSGGERITGGYKLRVGADLTGDARKAAISAGYVEDAGGTLLHEGNLEGVRYVAGDTQIPVDWHALNRAYVIEIQVHRVKSALGVPEKMLLTPITVAVDGAILIGSLPFLSIAALLGAACSLTGTCK